MLQNTSEIRVRYQETDAMGIAYHGNYLTWFEIARINLLDTLGIPYRELEKQGYLLPVLEAQARYFLPSHFDERLQITCMIAEMPRVKIRIEYIVTREEKRLTNGYTLHAFMDRNGCAIKPPDCFISALKPHFMQSS